MQQRRWYGLSLESYLGLGDDPETAEEKAYQPIMDPDKVKARLDHRIKHMGRLMTDHPLKAGMRRTMQALIPVILTLGVALTIYFGAPKAWEWIFNSNSFGAHFVKIGIPILSGTMSVCIGTWRHKLHMYYKKEYTNFKTV